jgi:hypothetical protein
VIDGVADLDVAVAVAVGAHVARRREAGPQVCLDVLHGDEHRRLRGRLGPTVIEHVRVRIDQARKHGRLTQVNDLSSCRNLDLSLRSDGRDAVAHQQNHLLGQHLAALAVEQAAGTDRDNSRSRRALIEAAVGSHAWLRARPSPRSLWSLRPQRHRRQDHPEYRRQRGLVSHRAAPR